ncbi:hypothetical protein EGT07_11485 [Herbaspirillum sp. HC18]|nr:hypothetical protein EGT07_11485 [Herbaspirillum sp. HC18]
MNNLKQLLAVFVAAGIAGVAMAQASSDQATGASVPSGQASSGKSSKDPFVERRDEKKAAKKQYKSGDISKEEYQKEKAEAQDKLKASGERGTFEKNLDAPTPSGKSSGK